MNHQKLVVAALTCAFLLGAQGSARAFSTEMLVSSGSSTNRLDLVILGDGYRTQDQAQLTQDANNLLSALYAQDVFFRYRNYYNVKLVHVVSNEAGADNGSAGGNKDTALGAYFNCHSIDRLLCVDGTAVMNAAMADAPEFDQIVVLVNDSKYGGSGGQFATTSIAPHASDIPVHELGHSLFKLADEYGDATPGYSHCDAVADCVEPNATVFSTFSQLKWNQWVSNTTPLPTPDTAANATLVGAFAGARYFPDQYRPVSNCIMKSLGQHYCPVCTEQGVLTAYAFSGAVDSLAPSGPVSMTTLDTVQFSVSGPKPDPNTLSYNWLLDGVSLATNTTGTFSLVGSNLSAGNHVLKVQVHDDTSLVRKDPSSALSDSGSWNVTVSAPSFMSFENPARPWTTVFPSSVQTVADPSQGKVSLQVSGCFYTPVVSPAFSTTELQGVTGQMALDIKLPFFQPIPVWNGNIQLLVTIPGALVNNALIGNVTLLLNPVGTWTTATFAVPAYIRTLLQGNYANAHFTIAIQTANCLAPLEIDNLRFN